MRRAIRIDSVEPLIDGVPVHCATFGIPPFFLPDRCSVWESFGIARVRALYSVMEAYDDRIGCVYEVGFLLDAAQVTVARKDHGGTTYLEGNWSYYRMSEIVGCKGT